VALCLRLEFADIRRKHKAQQACRRAHYSAIYRHSGSTINYDTPHGLSIHPASYRLPNETQHTGHLLPHSWRRRFEDHTPKTSSPPWSSFEQRQCPHHPDPTTTWTQRNERDHNLAVYIPALGLLDLCYITMALLPY
jgi:hypothetical protein